MARSRRTRRRGNRKQRGGDYYGYTGPAFSAAAGVPVESRTIDTHCGDLRGAGPDVTAFKTVQFGGKKKTRHGRRAQRGGACGCNALQQRGGGGGTGGFGFNISNNDLGKMYSSLSVGACPPAQRGGAAADELGAVSYKTGYGFGPASVVSTPSAHYLNPLGYDRTVMAGGKRRSRRHRRKGRKGSRKH